MLTLKGTEVSSSYVQCFLYVVSSSINVSFSQYMDGYFLDRFSNIRTLLFAKFCYKPRTALKTKSFKKKKGMKIKKDEIRKKLDMLFCFVFLQIIPPIILLW